MRKEYTVLHITQSLGGVETSIRSIVNNIDDRIFKSIILCPDPDLEVTGKSGSKVKTYYIPYCREVSILNDLKHILATIKLVKRVKPDLLHCHSAKGGFIGRLAGYLAGIPTIYTSQGFSYLCTDDPLRRALFLSLEKLARSWTTLLLACSESEVQRAILDLNIPKEKVKLWKNCIAHPTLSIQRERPFAEPYIFSVGRPSFQKNVEMLVLTVLALRESGLPIRCVLAGAGLYSPLKEKILDLIKQHELENLFILLDWIEHEETLKLLAHAECFVLASRYEGLPYSILEAMALGKPVVATNVDGTKDCVINNHTGFLVDLYDIESMKDAVARLVQCAETRTELGLNARSHFVEHYDVSKNIQALEGIYQELLQVRDRSTLLSK